MRTTGTTTEAHGVGAVVAMDGTTDHTDVTEATMDPRGDPVVDDDTCRPTSQPAKVRRSLGMCQTTHLFLFNLQRSSAPRTRQTVLEIKSR